MDNMIKDLHELCETLTRAINTANGKIRDAGGKVNNADMEYIQRLTHSLKNIKTVMAMEEAQDEDGEYSERYSRDGSYRRGYSRGDSYRDSYEYARGRNAKRDSMGRYSSRRDGYSRDGGDMIDELRDLMQDAPNEQVKQDIMRIIEKMQ